MHCFTPTLLKRLTSGTISFAIQMKLLSDKRDLLLDLHHFNLFKRAFTKLSMSSRVRRTSADATPKTKEETFCLIINRLKSQFLIAALSAFSSSLIISTTLEVGTCHRFMINKHRTIFSVITFGTQ